MQSSDLDSSLITPEQLELAFRETYRSANDRDIAALMAKFLEEVPAQSILDDGAMTSALDAEWLVTLSDWITQLKAFAGDAYPSMLARRGDALL